MTAKNPFNPPAPLEGLVHENNVEFTHVLWTIHRTSGPYRRLWNEPRIWGPLKSSRWDPRDGPAVDQPERSVLYAATDFHTSVAEVFQKTRSIPLDPDFSVASWRPSRPLILLDLTGNWPIRAGASSSLHAASKATCRNWARTIRLAGPHLDGLLVRSTMTASNNVILFGPSQDSFPSYPGFARPLNNVPETLIWAVHRELGWPVRAMN
ncbi:MULTISPECIES: RES family NAD+ phosphorylase [Arthrobacter]|uniref:RES family NAD+ phosphorylase n=2 Tax=Arthrobacter TaxID=1663 RepID=A0ABU9KP16_9MICC|nr:RES family NAD+ phosphorylase [Arthrobacter sp. YJM1]MDP5228643.1 RES family NAD+ phosphorylase [Arthrobacter sp. YJM1]